MTKLNIFLVDDCESDAAEIIDKLNKIAGTREKTKYSFDFKWLRGTKQSYEYERKMRSFYEPIVLEEIENQRVRSEGQNERMGILLDVLLTQEDIDNTRDSYYPQADLAKQIYFKFHGSMPIYVITDTYFATQSDLIMGVDLSEQFIAKKALLKYELKQDIDKLFRFYESYQEKR